MRSERRFRRSIDGEELSNRDYFATICFFFINRSQDTNLFYAKIEETEATKNRPYAKIHIHKSDIREIEFTESAFHYTREFATVNFANVNFVTPSTSNDRKLRELSCDHHRHLSGD